MAQFGFGPRIASFCSEAVHDILFLLKQDHTDSLGPSPSARRRTGISKKSSSALRKIQNPTHGHMQQRLHPGLSSSQNRATAHYGAVTGLRTTADGMYLLSSGK